jgi:hypothetical protein
MATRKNPEAVEQEIEQGLPQPGAGKKEYREETGTVTKVVCCYGYKQHLLVDVQHEAIRPCLSRS